MLRRSNHRRSIDTRMTLKRSWAALFGLVSILDAQQTMANPGLRVQVDQKGDFLLVGNALGYECAAGTPAPVVGTVGSCGNNGLGDSAPDVFWRADAPAAGQAQANNTITNANARSTAILNIPAGAVVTHAFLYWGGIAAPDTQVTVDRPGAFTQDVTAIQSYTSTSGSYQSVADVTALVQVQGSGAYRVSGADTLNFVDANVNVNFAGWWLVVLYQRNADPLRNLALFDGLDSVQGGAPQNTTLNGFLVPPAFGMAKLGVVTFEGDSTITGDGFSFDGVQLSNAQNPVDNFFNATRSFLGNPVSNAGDLPQLTGTAQSMGGMDLDVIDVTSLLAAGQTSAAIAGTSTGDQYYLAGFVTSIPTFKPDFSTSQKSAVDLNGGVLVVSDTIEYTISVINTGTDTSVNTVLTDVLPPQLTYVPGSLKIKSGANQGAKTDMSGDDQCEYVSATTTITCRLGAGATGAIGGQMLVGETTSVVFQARVKAGVSGTISNQAVINAAGLQGAPAANTPTDGNGGSQGSPPTDVIVEACLVDADCPALTPLCDLAATPNECVECLADSDCTALVPFCDLGTSTCVCIPSGSEICDGLDNDCNGMADDGIPGIGVACTTAFPGVCQSGLTACVAGLPQCVPNIQPDSQAEEPCDGLDNNCDGIVDEGVGDTCMAGEGQCAAVGTIVCVSSTPMCDAVPGTPMPELCGDGLDQNCNGIVDDGCADADKDGLTEAEELLLGTSPLDADSDDDGLLDGYEPNLNDDTDGDQTINALDPDSDADGLFDGLESGLDCENPDTDLAQLHCVADVDPSTVTNPLLADTDGGSVNDGDEDENHNGALDSGETDPTEGHGADDVGCTMDSQCGDAESGKVCNLGGKNCINGCHTPGNGCPKNQTCSSSTEIIGSCTDSTGGGGGAGGEGGSNGGNGGKGGHYSNFYDCSYSHDAGSLPASVVCSLILLPFLRRRRHAG